MPAFNMAHKSVFYGEGTFTEVTFVSNSVVLCILMSSQMTRLCCSVGTLITREFGQIIFNCIVHVHNHICQFYAPFARYRIIYLQIGLEKWLLMVAF